MNEPDDEILTDQTISDTDTGLLPDIIPIFPLSNVLLLPHAKLPLNIFEPRYLEMIDYALGQNRLIGIIQPRQAGEENQAVEPDVYAIGCLGRIISFNETGDGRYGITLLGISRFTVLKELPQTSSFRLARVEYEIFMEDLKVAKLHTRQRNALLKTVKAYLYANNIEAQWTTIEESADYALITSLAMLCPFSSSEKQALLECDNILERSNLLGKLMTLSLHAAKTPEQGVIH